MGKDREKARLLPNALLSALQALVTGAVMFFLYRYLLRVLGVEAVGLWSLILATTSLARISELGLSGSALRYVSKHLARGDAQRAAEALQTATLTIALLLGVIAVLLLPLTSWILAFILEPGALQQGRQLLPYALASLWLTGIGASIQAGVIGCHRADLNALVTIIASLAFLALAYLLVPRHGIIGLAYAQIAQGLLISVLSWAVARRHLRGLPPVPLRWSKPAFLEMWRYGATYQLTGLLAIVSDAIVKAFLSHWGSLAAVGYYEIAYRMVGKTQQLYASASVVMIPYFSKLSELDGKALPALLGRSIDIVLLLALALMGGLAALLPIISVVWIGHYESIFVQMSLLLIMGHLASGVTYPIYLANMGTDNINWNLMYYLLNVLVTVLAGALLGAFAGAIGVVLARSLALIAAAAALSYAAQAVHATRLSGIVLAPRNIKPILGAAILVGAGFVLYHGTTDELSLMMQFAITMVIYVVVLAVMFLPHREAKNSAAALRRPFFKNRASNAHK